MTKPDHPEVGRQLKPSELKPQTVVWVQKEGRNHLISMWVDFATSEMVSLWAGQVKVTLLLRRNGEDLFDDSGAPIALYEYLGKS